MITPETVAWALAKVAGGLLLGDDMPKGWLMCRVFFARMRPHELARLEPKVATTISPLDTLGADLRSMVHHYQRESSVAAPLVKLANRETWNGEAAAAWMLQDGDGCITSIDPPIADLFTGLTVARAVPYMDDVQPRRPEHWPLVGRDGRGFLMAVVMPLAGETYPAGTFAALTAKEQRERRRLDGPRAKVGRQTPATAVGEVKVPG